MIAILFTLAGFGILILICVQGFLHESWSERRAGLRISKGNFKGRSVTELKGHLRDQSELTGVLNSLYNMHLTILLVKNLYE